MTRGCSWVGLKVQLCSLLLVTLQIPVTTGSHSLSFRRYLPYCYLKCMLGNGVISLENGHFVNRGGGVLFCPRCQTEKLTTPPLNPQQEADATSKSRGRSVQRGRTSARHVCWPDRQRRASPVISTAPFRSKRAAPEMSLTSLI